MGAESTINLVLATVTHRLDQLTKPSFDRATVEELMAEIFRLRSEEHRHQIANELAWRDSKIDEQQEELDELGDEIEGLTQTVDMQRQRIEMLLDANTVLANRLDAQTMRDRPPIHASVPSEAHQPNRVLPMRPGDMGPALDAAMRGSASQGILKALPLMELTDDGLAVLKDAANAVAEAAGLPSDIVRSVRHVPLNEGLHGSRMASQLNQLQALPSASRLLNAQLELTDEGLAVVASKHRGDVVAGPGSRPKRD